MTQEYNWVVQLLPTIIAGLIGFGSGAVGVVLAQWLSRRTFVSNKIFEQRVDALNGVWATFIELGAVVHKSISLGHKRWCEGYLEAADTALERFRSEVDKSQIILDRRIIEGFRKLDVFYFMYVKDLQEGNESPCSLEKDLRPILDGLQESINQMMNKRTQKITLELKP